MSNKQVCSKCGREGRAGNVFCEFCGGKLKEHAPPAPSKTADRPSIPLKEGNGRSRAWLIFLVIYCLFAFGSRFAELGVKPLHHDESIHAMGAYDLFKEFKYKYNPGYHGPLLYYLMASSYYLFGDSDATCRFPTVFFGLMLYLAVWK